MRRLVLLVAVAAVTVVGWGRAASAGSPGLDLDPDSGPVGQSFVVVGEDQPVFCDTDSDGEFDDPTQVRWDSPPVVLGIGLASDYTVSASVPAGSSAGSHFVSGYCPNINNVKPGSAVFVVTPSPTATSSSTSTTTTTTTPFDGDPRSGSTSSTTGDVTTTSAETSTTVPESSTTTRTPSTRPDQKPDVPLDRDEDGDDEDGDDDDGRDEDAGGAPLGEDSSDPPAEDQSVIAVALPTPDEVSFDPQLLATNAVLALVLVLLIAFPAELFNKTVEENEEEIRGWFGLGERQGWWVRAPAAVTIPVFLVVTAAIATLIDPDFGSGQAWLVLFVGLLVALGVSTLAFELPIGAYVRNACRRPVRLRSYPTAIVLCAVCVAASRLAGFVPGYLYGIVAGYVVVDNLHLSDADEGRSVLRATVALFAVSVAAWFVWWPVHDQVDDGSGGALLVADSVLAAVFVAGIESLLFALVPLRYLDGQKLSGWDRRVWMAIYGVVVFAFVQVVLNPQVGYLERSSDTTLPAVLALFAGFGLGSVAFWSWFRFRRPREQPA